MPGARRSSASSLARLTATSLTPGTRASAFSTRATQAAQLMPSMLSATASPNRPAASTAAAMTPNLPVNCHVGEHEPSSRGNVKGTLDIAANKTLSRMRARCGRGAYLAAELSRLAGDFIDLGQVGRRKLPFRGLDVLLDL